MDDDGSAERQIQSVFDFLDEPDDLNRGLEYWGANPRHSLTEHDDDDDTQEHKTTADSSDEDVSHSPPLLAPNSPLSTLAVTGVLGYYSRLLIAANSYMRMT